MKLIIHIIFIFLFCSNRFAKKIVLVENPQSKFILLVYFKKKLWVKIWQMRIKSVKLKKTTKSKYFYMFDF